MKFDRKTFPKLMKTVWVYIVCLTKQKDYIMLGLI